MFKYETGKNINNKDIPLYGSESFDEVMKVYREQEYDFLRRCWTNGDEDWTQNWLQNIESWSVAEPSPHFDWMYCVWKTELRGDTEIHSHSVNTLEEAVAFQVLFEEGRNTLERNAPAGKYQVRQKWDIENNCWKPLEFYDNGTQYSWLPILESPNWTYEVEVITPDDVEWNTFTNNDEAFAFAQNTKTTYRTAGVDVRRYQLNGNKVVIECWNRKTQNWR